MDGKEGLETEDSCTLVRSGNHCHCREIKLSFGITESCALLLSSFFHFLKFLKMLP